jgi:hypothetical protein
MNNELSYRTDVMVMVMLNDRSTPEVILTPLLISRNSSEQVLIESSINSVRLSIRIKQADEIERILCHKFTRFLMMRAEGFIILRRIPINGFDITFLVTNSNVDQMLKHKLVDFVIQFVYHYHSVFPHSTILTTIPHQIHGRC